MVLDLQPESKAGMDYSDLAEIRINEAAPVIGDVAMETISETVITESTVIGHNPSTPGGTGIGVGTSVLVTELSKIREARDVIVIVPNKVRFAQAAALMNQAIYILQVQSCRQMMVFY